MSNKDILTIMKNRRSVRKYQAKEIPKEIIDELIDSLIWAPSAGNLQSRKFYFVFNEEIKRQLVKASLGQIFIAEAPLVVVACADTNIEIRYGERGKNIYMICDVAVAVENMMLTAAARGLGSCFTSGLDEKETARILKLPKNLVPIAVIPVGYPEKIPSAPPRVSKKEAVNIID